MKKEINNSIMFDLSSYNEIITKLNSQERAKIKEECNHELVVMFGKSGLLTKDEGYSKCLFCEETFYLKSRDLNRISYENVIDLIKLVNDGLITEGNLYKYSGFCGQEKHLVFSRIREMLKQLSSDMPYLTKEEVKKMVIEDLINYDKELNNVMKKELKRNDNNE